ncbi:MAG: hypothetical protein ACKOXB_11850 [Flavobacteriales bacterium]
MIQAGNKYLSILKILVALAFPVYYLIMNNYYRLSMDDFSFYCLARKGVINGAVAMYKFHEGAFLLEVAIISSFLLTPYVFFIVSLALLYISFFYFFSSVWKRFETPMSKTDTFLITSLFISALYFISPNIPTLWHWMDGTGPYTVMMFVPALFILSFLMRGKVLYAMPFLVFFMQTRITWALIAFGWYFLYCVYDYYKNRKIDKYKLFTGILMIAALVIYIIAPGNFHYKKLLVNQSSVNIYQEGGFWWTMGLIFKGYFLKMTVYALIFFFPICLLVKDELVEKIRLRGIQLFIPALILVISVVLNAVLMYLATERYFHAGRVWNMASFLFAFVFLYYLVLAWKSVEKKLGAKAFFNAASWGSVAISIALGLYLIFKTLYINYPIISAYAAAFDERINQITNTKLPKGSEMFVDPLPPSGVLPEWGLKTKRQPNGFLISEYYNLPFEVYVKEPTKE